MNGLFHSEIFMPEKIKNAPPMFLDLKPSKHAKRAADTDRYGVLKIPSRITFSGKDIVEAEFSMGKVVKIVVRLAYDATRDAIYVCHLDGFLKTVWFNLKSDKHFTLDASKYQKAR